MAMQKNDLASALEFANWEEDSEVAVEKIPQPLRMLMSDRGSLTSALKEIGRGTFKVNVLAELVKTPFLSESDKLKLSPEEPVTVREVELHIFDTPVVYARSVIPTNLTKRTETGLAKLGTKPLGHLLFKDGKMRKSRREFCCINGVFGRRTPYDYEGETILVNEFFLESLKKYLVE